MLSRHFESVLVVQTYMRDNPCYLVYRKVYLTPLEAKEVK